MLVLCPSWLHIYCCHYYVYYCHFAQCHIPILFLPRRQRSLISSEGRRVVVHQSLELQMRLREDFIITEKARTSVFNVKVLVGAFNQSVWNLLELSFEALPVIQSSPAWIPVTTASLLSILTCLRCEEYRQTPANILVSVKYWLNVINLSNHFYITALLTKHLYIYINWKLNHEYLLYKKMKYLLP